MNESHEDLMAVEVDDDYVKGPRWWTPDGLLTVEASAITAFTLAIAGLMGWIGFPVAEALVGIPGGPAQMQERLVVSALIVLVVLIGAFWLCQRVLLDDDDDPPAWARHLAGASVVIAGIGTAFSIVTVVGALLVHEPGLSTRIGP
ncbi:MAG: hypothetical protein ACR2KK_02320 [Acidimicrobiales bacterium]